MFTAQFIEITEKKKLLMSGGLGTMGFGLPAAIGATFGAPERTVCVFMGDGGLQMNIQELATIKEYGLNILIFIINNSQYGIIRQHEVDKYDMEPYQIDLKNPDFVKVAEAYGLKAKRAEKLEDLQDVDDYDIVDVAVRFEDIPLPK